MESGRLRVVLFNRFFFPIYRFSSRKQTQVTQRNLNNQQFPNPLTAKQMGIHRLSYRYPSVFSLKFGCPARALDWRILQQICFRTACDYADKKNTSSAGFASNIFESMMQILTRQNLHAKDKCMLELPPWLINMQRISTFKTTKEPPQDGFGA